MQRIEQEPLLKLYVPAIPVAQPRPQATTAHGGKHARVHEKTHIKNADGTRKPHPILAYKATVKHAAALAYTGAPLKGPLRVDVVFVFPRLSTQFWKTKAMPRGWHAKKPDRDNCDKGTLDALKGIIFSDDSQVCCGWLEKRIASGEEQPHVEITVWTLE